MTLQELSQHCALRKKLRKDEEILLSLRVAAEPGAQVITGMPHAPGVYDRVGDLATEIAEMQLCVDKLRKQVEREAVAISLWIDGIRDDQTRMIFRLRFLRGMSWKRVAAVIGGGNTEASVKSVCYRYLNLQRPDTL